MAGAGRIAATLELLEGLSPAIRASKDATVGVPSKAFLRYDGAGWLGAIPWEVDFLDASFSGIINPVSVIGFNTGPNRVGGYAGTSLVMEQNYYEAGTGETLAEIYFQFLSTAGVPYRAFMAEFNTATSQIRNVFMKGANVQFKSALDELMCNFSRNIFNLYAPESTQPNLLNVKAHASHASKIQLGNLGVDGVLVLSTDSGSGYCTLARQALGGIPPGSDLRYIFGIENNVAGGQIWFTATDKMIFRGKSEFGQEATAAQVLITFVPPSGHTADQTQWTAPGASGTVRSRIKASGHIVTALTSAPADGDLANNEIAMYHDGTKPLFRVKDGAGAVTTFTPGTGSSSFPLSQASASAVGDDVLRSKLTADTEYRYVLDADGKQWWGLGATTAPDVSLTRSAVGRLSMDGQLSVSGIVRIRHATTTASSPFYTGAFYDADGGARFGVVEWGISADRPVYYVHLNVKSEGGATTAGGQGIRVSVGSGKGFVVDLYGDQEGGARTSRGIEFTTIRTGTNSGNDGLTDYGFYLQHHKSAPFFHGEQLDASTTAQSGVLIELLAQASWPNQKLMKWSGFKPDGTGWGGSNDGGFVESATGRLVLLRGGVDVYNSTSTTSWGGDLEEETFSTHTRIGMISSDSGITTYRWAGGASLDTTLAAASSAGATTVSATAAPTVGMKVRIDTGGNVETRVVTTVTGAGPYTVGFGAAAPLRLAHASGVQVYAGSFYASRWRTDGNMQVLQQSTGGAAVGSETWDSLLALHQGRNVSLGDAGTAGGSFASGYGVVRIANANPSFLPSGTVTDGAVFYVDAGVPKVLTSSGALGFLSPDAAAGTASLRTLGTGATQAATGSHSHAGGGGGDLTFTRMTFR